MHDALKYLLPAYLLIFLGIAFLWRVYVVWKRTGKNAYVLRVTEGVHGVIAFGFRLVAASVAAVLIYSTDVRWARTTSREGRR